MVAITLAALALGQTTSLPTITRSPYGVPLIQAQSLREGFRGLGFAVAQDRLWQLEMSRRTANGTMAEVMGPSFVASDREAIQTGYSREEVDAQIARLLPEVRESLGGFVEGVNAYLAQATDLPPGYAQNGFKPEPWTAYDSMAITLRLLRRFGSGGAGELRNMALLSYFGTQPKLKGKEIDLLDDFLWQDDPQAIPTLEPKDDPQRANPPRFFSFNRAQTQAHLAALPKLGLLELLPAVRMASEDSQRRVAERVGAPFKTGSYAIVVGPSRSKTGHPILLSAPQMGFSNPTVVYEAAIVTPNFRVSGMTVPGFPGFAIGHTPTMANALTTGAADTEDIAFYRKAEGGYRYGETVRPLQRRTVEIKVKGQSPQSVVVTRTHDGPVMLDTREAVFARRSVFWQRESDSLNFMWLVLNAKSPADIDKAADSATVNFNFFYAFADGQIGWRFLGQMPIRAPGYDPRFPTPGGPETEWRGTLPVAKMPSVKNPASGILANWNNKPSTWWPNGDTPTWQRLFRNRALLDNLTMPLLSTDDVERAAWDIARREATSGYNYATPGFLPHFRRALALDQSPAARHLRAFDGRTLEGAIAPTVFQETFRSLRTELFTSTVGTFINPEFFETAIQPAVILAALEGRTKTDFRAGRKADDIIRAAFAKAVERLRQRGENPDTWAYRAPSINIDPVPVPYSNRGTYIQIIELGPTVRGRNVMPPGNAESGPHRNDQVALSRAWTFKPMVRINP